MFIIINELYFLYIPLNSPSNLLIRWMSKIMKSTHIYLWFSFLIVKWRQEWYLSHSVIVRIKWVNMGNPLKQYLVQGTGYAFACQHRRQHKAPSQSLLTGIGKPSRWFFWSLPLFAPNPLIIFFYLKHNTSYHAYKQCS